jgi:hypothetical protein
MYITGSGKQIKDNDFDKIINIIKEKLSLGWYLAIGCDSQKARRGYHVFVEVIALINEGHGGIFFVKRTREKKKYSLAEKLYKETAMSISVAEKLTNEGVNIDKIEIHLDISKNGKSGKFISGIVGMCTAYGFAAKIKDEAWASSGIADRYSR